MYSIICEGEVLTQCDEPRYVKMNPENGVYVQASFEDAEGIAVNSQVYNLIGKPKITDGPEINVVEVDAAQTIFQNTISTAESLNLTESALCELDMKSDDIISRFEDALCELDKRLNSEVTTNE